MSGNIKSMNASMDALALSTVARLPDKNFNKKPNSPEII